ncbi:hypothetical protein PVAND_014214 [Polypedilum vanderplanki]|uniref:RING-CH-type domain-containing protein n=1 Tax=Polypedilum vanderplanki TaxID=319348 RepID=A0A9J6CTJ6_POLVA|nr:hypothetical protein PVAND_014214 [Polypedilum vanderplanki]
MRLELMMACNEADDDIPVCNGRGECIGPKGNETCVCEIKFTGDNCDYYNKVYLLSISSVFYVVAIISIIQLLICCFAEYKRLKQPSLSKAFRITTQKCLYFVVFVASLLRACYFTNPESAMPAWSYYLMTAFYPLLMTCASLIVCFWAETFHLRDIRYERQFLSKSLLGFFAFNLLPYSLFLAEILSAKFFKDRNLLHSIFNGAYAILLLIVVVFFLIYGVEVFFKIRGGFVYDAAITHTRGGENVNVNASQVHQSRFGLLSQALMLMVIVGFLTSEMLGDFWKQKVPVHSRNWYDVMFRMVEVGVVIWFLACLWNSFSPESLWLLNPRKLLTRQIEPVASTSKSSKEENEALTQICWICYDQDKNEPLITPCSCTGDLRYAHHECLRRWLVESYKDQEETDLKCRVCGTAYEIRRTSKLYWEKGFDIQHWTKTIILVSLMCITGVLAWVIISLNPDPFIRVLTAGFAIIIGYVCVKMLGENTVIAYQRAKVSSIDIVSNDLRISRSYVQAPRVNSISEDIEIDPR